MVMIVIVIVIVIITTIIIIIVIIVVIIVIVVIITSRAFSNVRYALKSAVLAPPPADLDCVVGTSVKTVVDSMVVITRITVVILELIHVPKPDFLEGWCRRPQLSSASSGPREI